MLDKGVKVLDCPGVVLEDFGAHQEDEEQRRQRLGEVMLRNCIKVEEIEDPIAPVEAILARVDMAVMQGLYPGIQPYNNVTEFLIQVALSTGRLKGVSASSSTSVPELIPSCSKESPTSKRPPSSSSVTGTTEKSHSTPKRPAQRRRPSILALPRLPPRRQQQPAECRLTMR